MVLLMRLPSVGSFRRGIGTEASFTNRNDRTGLFEPLVSGGRAVKSGGLSFAESRQYFRQFAPPSLF